MHVFTYPKRKENKAEMQLAARLWGGLPMDSWKARCLFILFFLFTVSGVSQAAILLDRVVAIVNQEVITWSELYKDMDTDASPQLRELKQDEKRKIYKENEESFLETLINVKLQIQEAKSAGLVVGDGEVNEAIDNIRKKYSMTDQAFEESLKKEGYTSNEYRKRLKEQILIGKVVNQQVKSKLLVTDEEVKKILAESRDNEGYRISQIFFRKPENSDDNRKVEERAASVLEKFRKGGNFSDLAKQYSEDRSAPDGGDLGFIKKDNLLREFADTVAHLKPGEVSNPFWTDRGLHIIKLEEARDKKTLTEMKEAAVKAATEKLFTDKYNAWIKSLREKSFIEIRL